MHGAFGDEPRRILVRDGRVEAIGRLPLVPVESFRVEDDSVTLVRGGDVWRDGALQGTVLSDGIHL